MYDFLKEVESPNCPMVLEVLVNFRGETIASKDFSGMLWHLSCWRIQCDINFIDDVLDYLWLGDLDFYVWQAMNIDTKVIFNVTLVFNV